MCLPYAARLWKHAVAQSKASAQMMLSVCGSGRSTLLIRATAVSHLCYKPCTLQSIDAFMASSLPSVALAPRPCHAELNSKNLDPASCMRLGRLDGFLVALNFVNFTAMASGTNSCDSYPTPCVTRGRTLTASSLSLMASSSAAMASGTAVLQKPVIRLNPPYVMMGMMPARQREANQILTLGYPYPYPPLRALLTLNALLLCKHYTACFC